MKYLAEGAGGEAVWGEDWGDWEGEGLREFSVIKLN